MRRLRWVLLAFVLAIAGAILAGLYLVPERPPFRILAGMKPVHEESKRLPSYAIFVASRPTPTSGRYTQTHRTAEQIQHVRVYKLNRPAKEVSEAIKGELHERSKRAKSVHYYSAPPFSYRAAIGEAMQLNGIPNYIHFGSGETVRIYTTGEGTLLEHSVVTDASIWTRFKRWIQEILP